MNKSSVICLGDALESLKTGLNPRKNFKLNTDDATNWYITVKELNGTGVDFLEKTDKVNEEGLKLINKRSNLEIGDVLFSGTGSIGKTAIIKTAPKNWNIKEGVYSLKPKKKILDSYYLLCLLQYLSNFKVFNHLSSGSTLFSVPMRELESLKINLPDLKKQKSLIKIIEQIDSKIELNNKINAELEAMAKLIYDYWFVQLDFPDKNGKPYKSSGGKMIYNEELKQEIPEGWEVGELGFWIDRDKSGDWGKEKSEGNYTEKVSCIRGADINGLNGQGKVKAPRRYILNKNSHKILEAGDLIIEISGGSPTQSTGRLGYIIDSTLERFKNPLICSNFCRAITLTDRKYIYNFIQLWNRLYNAGVLFGWEGKTSGIKNLLFDSFISNYSQPIPEYKLVEKYYDKVNPIYTKIQHNLKENEKLAELRDWLLPMLMNGQVTVK